MPTNDTYSMGSDNHSGVHPEFLKAIVEANSFHQHSYGHDQISQRSFKEFHRVFGANTETFYVFNGTAANVLGIGSLIQSYNSVICSECSHLNESECGAPEKNIGCKLITLPDQDGKISAQQIEGALIRLGDQHFSQPKLVSLTQPTEYGTVYTVEELREISDLCKWRDLFLHIDGARFFAAAEHLNASPKQLTADIGVDVLSLSGTKNGFLYGEAVVFFNHKMAEKFKYLRKQLMQLPSKTRFVAAQFEHYLKDDFFLTIAKQQNQLARQLAESISPYVELTRPVQTNSVFVKIPKAWVKSLRKTHFFYVWEEHTFECRLMITFDTPEQMIEEFTEKLRELKAVAPSS